MHHRVVDTTAIDAKSRIECTISKALMTARLLTASIEQAESAIMKALDSWDPATENEEALFQQVLHAAVDSGSTVSAFSRKPTDTLPTGVPVELRGVIALPLQLRRCFVLRILAGLSRAVCAQMLNVHARRVDQYTSAAVRRLPTIAGRSRTVTQYFVYRENATEPATR
jgi:hypothetical protein